MKGNSADKNESCSRARWITLVRRNWRLPTGNTFFKTGKDGKFRNLKIQFIQFFKNESNGSSRITTNNIYLI